MNNNFEFKRGDSVLHNLMTKDGRIQTRTAIVLSADKKVEVRVDEDGSLWTTDLEGNAFDLVENNQFLKIQKMYSPVQLKHGELVTCISFHIDSVEDYNYVKATIFYENRDKETIEINVLENNYIDFQDKYKYVKSLK